MEESGYFAVRCVFRHTSGAEDEYLYEERITLWSAESFDEAIAKAEAEALDYAAALDSPPSSYVGLAQAYKLADQLGEGSEVFSLARTSELAPELYLNSFFDTGTERQVVLPD